jgi:hypothetical protein
MRIALRTSGGRGEYEIAGSHDGIRVAEIVEKEIFVEVIPGKIMRTNNFIKHVQGKPRIRLLNPNHDRHIYLLLSDVLLLPKPKREISATPGGKLQLFDNNYSIISIQFDIVVNMADKLIIHPTNMVLSNSENDLAKIDIIERLRILFDLYEKASSLTDDLSTKLKAHQKALDEGDLISICIIANEIKQILGQPEDPLRQVIYQYELLDEKNYWMAVKRDDVESAIVEEDLTNLRESSRNRIREWRRIAVRGAAGTKFSSDVKAAYNYTCIFSGTFLPQTSYNGSAGVDSAHILPWAEYGLNSITNGICINKLCHWAFDEGILKLEYIRHSSEYVLSVSADAVAEEEQGKIDLRIFHDMAGAIPENRLPKDKSLWPKPRYLDEYNKSSVR